MSMNSYHEIFSVTIDQCSQKNVPKFFYENKNANHNNHFSNSNSLPDTVCGKQKQNLIIESFFRHNSCPVFKW